MDSFNEQSAEKYLLLTYQTSLYYPFGEDVRVFRVKNKMFATISHGSTAKSAEVYFAAICAIALFFVIDTMARCILMISCQYTSSYFFMFNNMA